MNINITGRQMDTGNALRVHVETRLTETVSKYFERPADINVTFSKQGHIFQAACALHLDTGLYLQALGSDADVYHSFDQSVAKIEKQLRRYKRRLKNHHEQQKMTPPLAYAPDTVMAPEKIMAPENSETELPVEFTPVIVAESTKIIPRLSVSEAVMQLEIGDSNLVIFRSTTQDRLNLVYRRDDKNIGWLELPQTN